VKIDRQHENIVRLSDIRRDRSSVSSPFGPVNPASTTSVAQEIYRANQLARLTELLNSLENVVQDLNYKSFTAYDTLNTAIEAIRVALSDTVIDDRGTDETT
jgi:hypothetical protein